MSALASYAVVTSDKHGTIVSVNQNACQMFGYAREEMVGKKVNILMPSPYREQHDTYMSRYHSTRVPHVIGRSRDVFGQNKDGQLVTLRLTLTEADTVRGMMYIALFERAPENKLIFDVDAEGVIRSVAGNYVVATGYHKHELLGQNISLICPDALTEVFHELSPPLSTRKPHILGRSRNFKVTRKDGEDLNVAMLVNPIVKSGDQGESPDPPTEFHVIMTPVDDVEAMVTLSKTGLIISASPEFFLLFGYKQDEVLGINISRLVKGDLREILGDRLRNKIVRKNIMALHRDLSVFSAEIEIQKVTVSEGADVAKTYDTTYVCKIIRVSANKKEDSDMIPEGEYMGMYKYGKTLGTGYFGKVRMAYHRITGEKVAIKTLRKKQYLSVNMEYPPREISVLKAIDHPNINRLYDTVVLADRIYLILEFVEGRELCEIVETEFVPEEVCRHVFRQILSAVLYLHSNGIAHRDLKLENIIVDQKGHAKVIDLGFGNFILDDDHLFRTFCGSPDYAAPELFLGKAYHGKQADIWSLGVLLFAMLSGLLPFPDSQSVLKGKYEFPPSITPKAQDLIRQIFQVDPSKRISLAGIIEHPWTNQGYKSVVTADIYPSVPEPDQRILDNMTAFGMNPSTVRNSLLTREFNQFTTTYYLLQKKSAREAYQRDMQGNNPPSMQPVPRPDPRHRARRFSTGPEDCVLL